MNVFHRQACLVQPWHLFTWHDAELACFVLHEAGEGLLVDQFDVKLHHEKVDQMDQVMTTRLDEASGYIDWLELLDLRLLQIVNNIDLLNIPEVELGIHRLLSLRIIRLTILFVLGVLSLVHNNT